MANKGLPIASVLLIFTIALFALGYVTGNSIKLLIWFWLIIWTIVYAGIPWQLYIKLIIIPISFWLMSLPALVMGISSASTLEQVNVDMIASRSFNLSQWCIYLSHQGLQQAIDIFCNSICLTGCMYFMLLTIPFTEILQLLNQWGCPSLITELLLLMYRFIFVLTQTAT